MSEPIDNMLVSLNALLTGQQNVNVKAVSDFLIRKHLSGLPNANCASGFCDCNAGYCSCHGNVSKEFNPAEVLSFPEIERLRNAKIEALKAQLKALEG